jgi:hypothetical protein
VTAACIGISAVSVGSRRRLSAMTGEATRDANRHLCEEHVLPYLGARKLRDLTATEVDEWLATLARSLSTRTLQGVRACLNRAVRRAMARDKVKGTSWNSPRYPPA